MQRSCPRWRTGFNPENFSGLRYRGVFEGAEADSICAARGVGGAALEAVVGEGHEDPRQRLLVDRMCVGVEGGVAGDEGAPEFEILAGEAGQHVSDPNGAGTGETGATDLL